MFGITEESIFTDFVGFAQTNSVEKVLNAKSPQYYFNLGMKYYQSGKYAEAIKEYDHAIELDPKYAFAYNDRGVAKRNLGAFLEASSDFLKAKELAEKTKDSGSLAIIENNLKDLAARKSNENTNK